MWRKLLVAADWTAVGGEPYIYCIIIYIFYTYCFTYMAVPFRRIHMYKQFLQVYVYIYICIPMTSDIFAVHIVYNLYGFLARLQEHTAPPTSDPPASTGYPNI